MSLDEAAFPAAHTKVVKPNAASTATIVEAILELIERPLL
jgi:hypothetical protein